MQICRFSNLQSFTAAIFLTLFAALPTQQMFAQLSDAFDDGDFNQQPAWSGTSAFFQVVNQQLRLIAPPANGLAYLSTPSNALEDGSWEIDLALDFNPSATNYARIYLTSDQSDLSGPLNGYFIQAGGATDDVSLYRQTGLVTTKVVDGQDGLLNQTAVALSLKVTRDANGLWQLFSALGSSPSSLEGTVNDQVVLSAAYFGVSCVFTATRSDKFLFDNFIVTGHAVTDKTPPVLSGVQVLSSRTLSLTFSENLDQVSAETSGNFSLESNGEEPVSVILQLDGRTVVLGFAKDFANGFPTKISVTGVSDLAGNHMAAVRREFTYLEAVAPVAKDIVLSEIFPDPSPKVGLPETEFVELFNRSQHPFSLKNWNLTDGSSVAVLPSKILLPGDYLVLASPNVILTQVQNVIYLANFPSLNNGADDLMLKDDQGLTIDSVHYSDAWYGDDDKKQGGWSLEIIDPDNRCSERQNWTASDDPTGGTPGRQNSVFASKPDLTGPKLLSAVPGSASELVLTFDEKLAKALPGVSDFKIEPSIEVASVSFADAALTQLNLTLPSALLPGLDYALTVNHVQDCAGNNMAETLLSLGLPETADSLDIALNEILFNPRPTGTDFLEIVNVSKKYFNLKNWSVANREDGMIKNAKVISTTDFLLKPGAYLVLTVSSNVLKGEYPLSQEENFLEVPALPSWSDGEGSVALLDDTGLLIDHFSYTKNLHSPFIKDDEGVSLERISFDVPAYVPTNWKSASSTIGFATPGYVNSSAVPSLLWDESTVQVTPPVFVPSLGQPNFTQIHYAFAQGGFVANVNVFDLQGHRIKTIANNEILGTEGFFRWEGDRDSGDKARIGPYMVWFEIFDGDGNVTTFRKEVVVAAKF
ncbi:lamin tail domain-containing protein [Chryseolinea soli]|nr:lamin tail domain-containing protein [Chryseolinea soli]